MSYWPGKTAIVTGGSSGLGKAIAGALASAGANVVIAARSAAKLEQAAAELRSNGNQVPYKPAAQARVFSEVLAVPTDITRQADVDALIEKTKQYFGRIDVLVNNAGRSARGEVLATTPEDFQSLIELNLIALVRCTRAAAPHLLETRGHVVNIGSLAAKSASRYMGAYAASKFAVAAYSQQLRLELGPQGLHVLLVCPGPIARDEPRQHTADELARLPPSAQQPGGGVKTRLLDPSMVARAILRACERRRPELILPAKARLLFVLSQISPRLGDWLVRKLT